MGCFHLVYNLIPRFLRLTSFGTSSQRSRNEVRWVGIGRNRIVGIRESNYTQGAADRATTKGVSSNRRSAADGCPPGVRQSWAIAAGRGEGDGKGGIPREKAPRFLNNLAWTLQICTVQSNSRLIHRTRS